MCRQKGTHCAYPDIGRRKADLRRALIEVTVKVKTYEHLFKGLRSESHHVVSDALERLRRPDILILDGKVEDATTGHDDLSTQHHDCGDTAVNTVQISHDPLVKVRTCSSSSSSPFRPVPRIRMPLADISSFAQGVVRRKSRT